MRKKKEPERELRPGEFAELKNRSKPVMLCQETYSKKDLTPEEYEIATRDDGNIIIAFKKACEEMEKTGSKITYKIRFFTRKTQPAYVNKGCYFHKGSEVTLVISEKIYRKFSGVIDSITHRL
ncbi:MAG: hypothetical protein ACLU8F_01765 [Clostridia bacterium]